MTDLQGTPTQRRATRGLGFVGPIAALVVLVVMALLTIALLGGPVPTLGIDRGKAVAGDVPNRTPDPVKVFTPADPKPPEIAGSILFAKAGNLWTVGGADVLTQLTRDGSAQYPSWSRDGSTIYDVRVLTRPGNVPCSLIPASGCGNPDVKFELHYPVIERLSASGANPVTIRSGLYSWNGGRNTYFSGLWQPAISPNGKTIALITDAPDPLAHDYQLAFVPTAGGRLNRPPLADDQGLGHNDPAWSPDGSVVAYTYDHRDGTSAAPRIALYDVKTRSSRFLTKPGYAEPSFSPDGRWLVAVAAGAKGEDVVILDASSGAELLRLTNDGHSFEPVWSPAGDQVAFLRAHGLSIDLWVDTLTGSGHAFSVTADVPFTSQSALDGTSKPSWFIPTSELPTPSANPSAGNAGTSAPPSN